MTNHLATRRDNLTLHVVANLASWYSGMTATTECGVAHADVKESQARREEASRYCKRCVKMLGWNYPVPVRASRQTWTRTNIKTGVSLFLGDDNGQLPRIESWSDDETCIRSLPITPEQYDLLVAALSDVLVLDETGAI
jgi:hypothetical protein